MRLDANLLVFGSISALSEVSAYLEGGELQLVAPTVVYICLQYPRMFETVLYQAKLATKENICTGYMSYTSTAPNYQRELLT